MTEEEKKAIENIKWHNEHLYCDKKDVDYMLNLIQKQDTEINKLNNVIDRMVEEYEYNVRINVKNFCEEQMRKDKCIQDCKTCIKEYFMKEDK